MGQQGIRWKRGEFHTFYAQMKIRVGGVNGNQSVDILSGDEFEYDGSIVKYAGAEFPQPGLRGAIRNGWATLDEDGEVPAAFTANRSVAQAQTVTKDLSRVQRMAPKPLDSDDLDEETVIEVADRQRAMDPVTGKGHLTEKSNRRTASLSGHRATLQSSLDVTQSDWDEQDHTPIGRIKSKANLGKIDITNPSNAGLARSLEMQSYEEGHGSFSGRRNVVEREGVTISTNVGSVDPEVNVGDDEGGRVVGRVRHTDTGKTREGIEVLDTSRRGKSSAGPAPAKKAKKAAPAKKAASKKAAPAKPAPAKKAAPAKPAPAVVNKSSGSPQKFRIAKRVCPEFPDDWNFFGKTQDKLDRLKELGSDPDMIDALYASESSSMKRALEENFPKHFS